MLTIALDLIPENDEARIQALHRYKILDTPPEEAFNNIARLMADCFGTPIALISLVDKDRVFFKGNVGMPGVKQTDRKISLCSFAILSNEPTVFENPLKEPCLLANPLVHGDFGLRFYAGAPLITADGYNIGSVCIVDKRERTFSAREQDMLVRFARMAMHEIELREAVLRQVEVERRLEEANVELGFVTNRMPQMVWVANANGYAYFFNQGWLDYTGLEPNAVVGDGWARSLHPDDREIMLDAWYHAVESGSRYEVEYRVRRYDGTYRWFLVRAEPMKDDQGRIIKWYGTSTDINDQKRAEEALRLSKERFDMVAKATRDAIWDWDLTSGSLWWNEGFRAMFGFSEAEIEPGIESWHNRIHPDDRDQVVGSMHAVLDQGGNNWSAEYRFLRKDGSYATVFDRGYVLHDVSGKPYRLLGAMQDISGRKHYEEALRESEARTRLAVESAQMGTFQVDFDNQAIIHSRRAAEIFGLDPDKQWPLSAFADAVIPEDRPIQEQAFREAQQTGEVFFEVRIRHANGAQRWIRLNGVLIRQDQSCHLTGTTLDITEEKEAASLLARKIEERTTELSAVNEQLRQFTYAASHDLQEPLRKISYYVDRLLSNIAPVLSPADKAIGHRIQHTTERMRNLIDDLLNYSNASAGTTTFGTVDLNDIVTEVLDDMEVTITEKGAVITQEELPPVQGDARLLRQLMHNLIGNALKYHKKNEAPQVRISASRVPAGLLHPGCPVQPGVDHYYEVSVSDKGIGFHPQEVERIFGLFQRLHGRAEYEGTGVGLAIAQKVVENHGGFILAEGKPGVGATFRCYLPVRGGA